MALNKQAHKKSDFIVFIYNPVGGDFWFYTKEALEEYDLAVEIHLTQFLPLTEETLSAIAMIHPGIPVDVLEKALKEWEDFPPNFRDDYYYFCDDRSEWR